MLSASTWATCVPEKNLQNESHESLGSQMEGKSSMHQGRQGGDRARSYRHKNHCKQKVAYKESAGERQPHLPEHPVPHLVNQRKGAIRDKVSLVKNLSMRGLGGPKDNAFGQQNRRAQHHFG